LKEKSELLDLCQEIGNTKNNSTYCRRLKYILRPIQWLYSLNKNKNIPLKLENMNTIEEYLFQLLHVMKSLKRPFDDAMKEWLEKNLKIEFHKVQQETDEAEKMCSAEIPRLHDLVLHIRNGASQRQTMLEMQIDEHRKTLEQITNFIQNRLKPLIKKEKLIRKLNEYRVKYLNVKDLFTQEPVDLETIEQQLLKNGERKIICCCKDGLEERNESTWDYIYTKWIKEYETNSSVELIYADFSYCSHLITEMKILLSDDMKNQLKNTSARQVPTDEDAKSLSIPTDILRSTSKVTHSSSSAAVASSTSANTTPPSKNESSSASHDTCSSHPKKKSSSSSTAKSAAVSSDQTPITSKDPPLPTPEDTALSTPEEKSPSKKFRSDQSNPPALKFVNVLLLGESGVGKSTFINALVNYLTFETFKQADTSKPLVVMPVSFMMTVGDHFEERTLRFGGVDPNEDHDHPGQSVTQHCRSYVFQIGTQTKLRIIDTPGMGDTRGLDQDDINMQHILSFVNNLPHLNAICILLKPNESRLNVVLRSYFTRLLNFVGENARNNIVFCFTNTRSTFFAPGNTGPLLRKMINDLPIKGIPFQKTNTFCFDSEAFRYLIAVHNGIEFDDYQKEEYQRSWESSVKESNRFLKYICGELESYPQNEWESIEHAQSKISQMARPIFETIRNIFRNMILLKQNSSKKLIKLCPTSLSQPSAICYKCDRVPIQLCDFLILPDNLHNLEGKCKGCKCSRQKHLNVDYQLEYESFDVMDKQPLFAEMKSDLEQLRTALLEFAQFYAYVVYTTKQNDPLLPGLNRMIAEEDQVRSPRNTKCYNSILHDLLVDVKKDYKEQYNTWISFRKPINLPNIYAAIGNVSGIDMVSEQMDIIKKTQKKYMKQHENQVS
jgi:GTPase SAR1 family protein